MFFLRMILGVFLFLQVVSAQGFIHADGTNIVEGNGEPILLRGFGLGGWLVPEGYMLHNQAWIEGFESPTQIENNILDLVGADFVDDFWDLYRANYVAQADIDQIADWGFNHLRIPFHYKQFYDDSSGVEPIGYGLIDTLISLNPMTFISFWIFIVRMAYSMGVPSVTVMALHVSGWMKTTRI